MFPTINRHIREEPLRDWTKRAYRGMVQNSMLASVQVLFQSRHNATLSKVCLYLDETKFRNTQSRMPSASAICYLSHYLGSPMIYE